MMADIQPALSRPITGQSMKRLRQRNSLRSTRGKPCWTVVFASAAVQTRRWNPTTLYTAYRQRRRGQLSTAAPGRLAAYGKAVCGRSFTAVHRDAGLFCIYGRENRQNKRRLQGRPDHFRSKPIGNSTGINLSNQRCEDVL